MFSSNSNLTKMLSNSTKEQFVNSKALPHFFHPQITVCQLAPGHPSPKERSVSPPETETRISTGCLKGRSMNTDPWMNIRGTINMDKTTRTHQPEVFPPNVVLLGSQILNYSSQNWASFCAVFAQVCFKGSAKDTTNPVMSKYDKVKV